MIYLIVLAIIIAVAGLALLIRLSREDAGKEHDLTSKTGWDGKEDWP